MRVTQRVLTKGIKAAITAKHVFYKKPVVDCEALLVTAKEELDRLVVLGLTAIFERTLRDYLVQYTRTALPPGDLHRDAVREEMIEDIEFWNVSSRVVEVFPAVDATVRGQAKQVIDYRNWVAHGHTLAKPAPSKAVPDKAYQVLTEFLLQAGVITP
jgi:hypothetical protein